MDVCDMCGSQHKYACLCFDHVGKQATRSVGQGLGAWLYGWMAGWLAGWLARKGKLIYTD